MQTKDKLENLDEKMELMEIRHEQRYIEILIVLESIKANAWVVSSSPQVESARLPFERLETRIPIPPIQSSHQQKVLRVYPQARNCKPQVSRIDK